MGKIGEALRKAREAKSITLRQAEEATKIRLKYLEALEREDYSQIPGRVYAIGFLRNYARYLGLDWQPLVEELKAALPPEEEEEYKISPSPSEESQDRPKKGLWRWFTVLLVVLLLWGLNQLYNRARPTPDTNLSLSPPAAENRGESPPQGQVSPPSPVPPSPLPPPISGVEVKVYIKEKECWIGVKIDGKDSFSGLLKAGETKTFHGDKEITLTLGSAGVAEVTVNNQVLPPLGRVGEVVTKTFTGSSTP